MFQGTYPDIKKKDTLWVAEVDGTDFKDWFGVATYCVCNCVLSLRSLSVKVANSRTNHMGVVVELNEMGVLAPVSVVPDG